MSAATWCIKTCHCAFCQKKMQDYHKVFLAQFSSVSTWTGMKLPIHDCTFCSQWDMSVFPNNNI